MNENGIQKEVPKEVLLVVFKVADFLPTLIKMFILV